MPKRKGTASLFRGKKPKSLPGGTSKKERTVFKSKKGTTFKKKLPLKEVARRMKWYSERLQSTRALNAFRGFVLMHYCSAESRSIYTRFFPRPPKGLVPSESPSKKSEFYRIKEILKKQFNNESLYKRQKLRKLKNSVSNAIKELDSDNSLKIAKTFDLIDELSRTDRDASNARHAFVRQATLIMDGFIVILDAIEAIERPWEPSRY